MLLYLALPDYADAVTRWVIPGAGATGCVNAGSNYDPATNTCGSGAERIYTSLSNVVSAMSSCDEAIFRAGTYAGSMFLTASKSGTSTCNTIFRGYVENNERPVFTGDAANPVFAAFYLDGVIGYIEFSNLEFDFTSTGERAYCLNLRGSGGYTHHVRFVSNYCHNAGQAISVGVGNPLTGNHYIAYNTFRTIGILATPLDPPGKNTFYGMGSNTIAEYNTVSDACNGFSIFGSGTVEDQNDVVIRYNEFYRIGRRDLYPGLEGFQCQTAIAQPSRGNRPKIYSNIIYDSFTEPTDVAIRVYLSYAGSGAEIYNNSIANTKGKGISVETGTGALVKNNIAYLTTGTGISITGGTGSASNNLTTNPSFKNVAFGDLTLTGSSAAIAAGVDVGLPFCGAAPSIGAFQPCGFSSASISGRTLTITMQSAFPPLQVFGPTGMTANCSGSNCGTPSVTSASLVPASASLFQADISGLGGSGICEAGQTWTFSYDAAGQSLSDYVVMGGHLNQFMNSFSAQPVTNDCGGGAPTPPANPYIWYKFDDGIGTIATDSSGNAIPGTLVNTPSWTTGKFSGGIQTSPGTLQYVSSPYGNGINPSTQSHSIAFGVKILPTTIDGIHFGADVGTDQRLYVAAQSGTWRLAVQASNAGNASELAVHSDWNHICLNLNSATDTATLYVDGVPSASAGGLKSYTSYTLASNFQIGRIAGNNAPGAVYDQFKIWPSVISCADEYAAWNPPANPWAGTLTLSNARIYGAKYQDGSTLIPLAPLDTAGAHISPTGIFTYAGQVNNTVASSAVSYKLYYSCAACPSGGTWLPVPDMATTDELEFYGVGSEFGLLSGAHGVNLSGALTHVNGGTRLRATGGQVISLASNNSTVERYIIRFTSAAVIDRVYCFTMREQSGLDLNNYALPSGLCVTVTTPSAAMGF